MVRTETFWGSAIMLVGVAGLAALVPFVDNGDSLRGVTGGMVTNSCAGDGGDVVTASADEPSPLACEVSRYFQESVTAGRSFVVRIGDRQVCYPARQLVRINPEASSPVPSVTAWTVEECR